MPDRIHTARLIQENAGFMTCSDFLARYSEFRDGDLSPGARAAFESHVERCGPCGRYHRVVTEGVSLLRNEPPPRLRTDFRERLRHSLYTLDEQRRLRRHRPHGATGSGAMFVVAAAVLILVVIWTPALWEATPTVELSPVVAEVPAGSLANARGMASFGMPADARPGAVYERDLWTGSNVLLFEHSALYTRYREPSLVRAGTQ